MNFSKIARGWVWLGGMALAGLALAGCQSGADRSFADLPGATVGQPQAADPQASGAVAPNPLGRDIIKVGDQLLITITDVPEPIPPIDDRVRDDGTIRLIQNLTFAAAGKNRSDLEKEIHATYVPKYFKTMTVQIKQMQNTQFYYVDGEVKQPDRQVYISQITVLKAIASAKGFTDFARKKAVVLTRANGQKHKINCVKAIQDPTLDLEVYPGDQIYVPRRNPIW